MIFDLRIFPTTLSMLIPLILWFSCFCRKSIDLDNYLWMMVSYVALTEFFVAMIYGYNFLYPNPRAWLCQVEGMLIQYFMTSTICWTNCIAYHLYGLVSGPMLLKDKKASWFYVVYSWGFPLLATLPGWAHYGNTSLGLGLQICWIGILDDFETAVFWRFVLFHIPSISQILYNVFLYYRTYLIIGSIEFPISLLYFPIVELICVFPINIIFIVQYVKPLSYNIVFPFWFLYRMQTLCHAFLYVRTVGICPQCTSTSQIDSSENNVSLLFTTNTDLYTSLNSPSDSEEKSTISKSTISKTSTITKTSTISKHSSNWITKDTKIDYLNKGKYDRKQFDYNMGTSNSQSSKVDTLMTSSSSLSIISVDTQPTTVDYGLDPALLRRIAQNRQHTKEKNQLRDT